MNEYSFNRHRISLLHFRKLFTLKKNEKMRIHYPRIKTLKLTILNNLNLYHLLIIKISNLILSLIVPPDRKLKKKKKESL